MYWAKLINKWGQTSKHFHLIEADNTAACKAKNRKGAGRWPYPIDDEMKCFRCLIKEKVRDGHS